MTPESAAERRKRQELETFQELEQDSKNLKAKIEAERRKSAMPLNASLGDPAIDALNADGRHDLPPDDED